MENLQNQINFGMGDQWDDNLLVNKYDFACNLTNEKLAKILAEETNKTTELKNLETGTNWKVGDYVRATYIDGIDYEAQIISIDQENGNCSIRYIGYENEEVINTTKLINSWGKKIRRKQFAISKQENEIKRNKQNHMKDFGFPSNFAEHNFTDFKALPSMPKYLNSDKKIDESAELYKVLMSWYMCGFQTGFYDAQKKS